MKKNLIAISVLSAVLLGNIPVFAATASIKQRSGDTVEISLEEFSPGSAVGIHIEKGSFIDFIDEIYTDADGKLTFKYKPRQSSGIYRASFTEPDNSGFKKIEKTFAFLLPETEEEIKTAFTNAAQANYPAGSPAAETAGECLMQFYTDYDEFIEVMTDSIYLGLTNDDTYNGQLEVFKKIKAPITVDINSVKNAFYEAVFCEKLAENKSLNTVKDLLGNADFDDALGFTEKIPVIGEKLALYSLSEDLASKAVSDCKIDTSENFIADLNLTVFKSIISNAAYYMDVRNVLEAYAGKKLINVDVTRYDSKTDSTLPFKAMIGKSYSDYADAADAFNSYTYQVSGGSSGGGGGGSSGSGSGSKVGSISFGSNAASTTANPDSTGTLQDNSGYPKDISEVSWAETYIKNVYDAGIMVGDNNKNFRPNDNITRAETAAIICRMIENNGMIADLPFSDVSTEDWFFPYVSAAYKKKLFSGKSADTFAPSDGITREEMATVLYRMGTVEKSETANFADSDEISDWAKEAVASLSAAGIIKGNERGSFSPKNYITRAEAAVMLSRMRGAE